MRCFSGIMGLNILKTLLICNIAHMVLSKTTYHHYDHEDHEPQDYSFSYGVKDYQTGDIKNQWEKKIGDTVHGLYSMLEADGSLRIVEYTADDKTGFHATVKHEGPSYHPTVRHAAPTSFKESHTSLKESHHTKTAAVPKVEKQQQQAIATYFLVADSHEEIAPEVTKVPIESEHQPQAVLDLSNSSPNIALDLAEANVEQEYHQHHNVNNFPHEIILNYDFLSKNYTSAAGNERKQEADHQFQAPEIETGFQPVKPYAKPVIPNTFVTDKKPISTPGLKTFATNEAIRARVAASQRNFGATRGPLQFPNKGQREMHREMERKLRFNNQKPKGVITYAKHITYFPDDDE